MYNTKQHQSMYNFKEIEKKWIKNWEDNNTFYTDVKNFSKPKYYVLDMFPYPSGNGLHVGHLEGYTATDILARMKRMQGYNVLHPMGFDSFGLPAEQYAIQTGNHPGEFTQKNIDTFITQLKMLGFSYDWSKQVSTCDPNYYKWTQWIFLQLYKKGLAKYADMPVNWCEELGTVLANDEVIDGKSERGGFPVVKKNMKQLTLSIQEYADKLINGLNTIDWPESTKQMQKNWIGRSEGADITFKIKDTNLSFTVFTTRCDTLFGATYCVLAPELDLVKGITTREQKEQVDQYIKECSQKTEIERTSIAKEKTGVFTGAYAINPVNKKEIPIYIADYVLSSYGTGAIMAVPAHDERDYNFAKKFNLDITPVIDGGNIAEEAYTGDGMHINSGFLNGLNKEESIKKMLEWLEQNKVGKKKISYKLHDWIFARQRYWGEPIPVVHMEDGTIQPLEEKDLPLVLPELKDYKAKDGKAPLDNAEEWVNVEINGKKGKRETTTMPGAAGSSWYFLRYIDPHNDEELANKELLKHWMPVDVYVGGAEHITGHLIYSRFWNYFLYDEGIVPVKEPFTKLCHPGIILGENGEKMSKSKGNVVNPNELVEKYGADTLRLYEMFLGPITDHKPWNDKGILGVKRFIDKIWRIYKEENKIKNEANVNLERIYNQTVKKVTEDYESMSYNTAISQMMIFINTVQKEEIFPIEYAQGFIKLLSPIAPFIAEEIWHEVFNEKDSITYAQWPTYDEAKVGEDTFKLIIQINGKIKAKIECTKDTQPKELENIALEEVKDLVKDKEIIKIIPVPNRLVNIVVKV